MVDRAAPRPRGRLLARTLLPAFMAVTLIAFTLAACDGRPSGPGFYSGSVALADGSPGAVLLLLTGEGVGEVTGEGGTQSWTHRSPGEAAGLRALLVDPDPSGALTFRVQVEDLSRPPPQVSVLEAADRNNQRLAASEVQVRLSPR